MIKDNVPSFILAFIVLGGWSTINIQQQFNLSDKSSEFEKYKGNETAKLRDQELNLNKERIRLDAQGKQLDELGAKAFAAANDAESKLSLVYLKERNLTSIALQVQEENEIKSLIKEFSELGVNLNTQFGCGKLEEKTKYNRALSLMSQITGRIKEAGVYKKYKDFINTNERRFISYDYECK